MELAILFYKSWLHLTALGLGHLKYKALTSSLLVRRLESASVSLYQLSLHRLKAARSHRDYHLAFTEPHVRSVVNAYVL